MRVAVLCGGVSGEREVSLRSGRQVHDALLELGHEAMLVDFGPGAPEELRRASPDLVFPTLHGPLGEDGTAAAILELLGIPYVGSGILAGALAMNKVATKRVWTALGLPTPAYAVVEGTRPEAQVDEAVARLGLPLVVKPNSAGSSLGLTIARDEDAVMDGVTTAIHGGGPDGAALLESFREGIEVTVGILGVRDPRALPTLEITYREGQYDFEAKYTEGMSHHIIPARMPEAQREAAAALALAAHKAVHARGLSRVDLICEPDGQAWLLEINTLPGMTALSLYPDAARAAGLEFPALIDRLVTEAMES